MTLPRVFVSHNSFDTSLAVHPFATRLIKDLRASGAEVVAGLLSASDDEYVQHLNQVLPTCQWMILIQTPEALRSLRVQMEVNTALNLLNQKRMKGVLAVIAAPYDSGEFPPTWSKFKSFDATQDYPRALTRLLLELGLPEPNSETQTSASRVSSPSSPPETKSTPDLKDLRANGAEDEPVPLSGQPPRPKNSHKMSTGKRAALINAISTIVVAIITAILVHWVWPGPTPNPTPHCEKGPNGFVDIPPDLPGTRVPSPKGKQYIRDVTNIGRDVTNTGVFVTLEHNQKLGWAKISGKTERGDRVWMEWTWDGGSHWLPCGPFSVDTAGQSKTSAAKVIHEEETKWQFRACGERPTRGIATCTDWW